MSISFTQLATLEKNDAITLARGKNESGAAIYAYIRMNRQQLKAFERAISAGKPIDFDDYGEVLASGEGEPEEGLLAVLAEEYGF